LIPSPIKMTPVSIRRKTPTDVCHNLTASQKFKQPAWRHSYWELFRRTGNGRRTTYFTSRACYNCSNEVENEFSVVMKYPLYINERYELIYFATTSDFPKYDW